MKQKFMKLFKNTVFIALIFIFSFSISNLVNADENTQADAYKTATTIALEKTVKGSYSNGENYESWYKIYVPTKCSINLEIEHHLPINYYLYNEELKCIYDEDWHYDAPHTDSFTVDIPEKGYYYLMIYNKAYDYERKIGNYSITYSLDSNLTNFRNEYYGSDKVKLVWDSNSNKTPNNYEIQQKIKGKWKTIKTTNKNAYTVKKLSPATYYSFRIRGYIKSGKTKYCSAWTTLKTNTSPAKGKITSAKVGKSSVKVNWKKTTADGYVVAISHDKYILTQNPSNIIQYMTMDYIYGDLHYVSKKKNTNTFKKYQGKKLKSCGYKRLYIRVCPYKKMTILGQKATVYGEWSSIKTLKIK